MAIGTAAAILGGSALSAVGAKSAAKSQEAAAQNTVQLQEKVYNDQTERLSPYSGAGTSALSAYLYELGLGPAPTIGGTAAPNYSIEEIRGKGTLQPIKDTGDGVHMVYGPSTFNVGGQNFDTREAAQAWIDSQPQSTGGTAYQGISMSPASQFLLSQGRDAIEAGAAARGGLYSGAALKGLEQYRQNIAMGDRDNQLNRLLGLIQTGQSAAAGQGAAGVNYANSAGNALMQGANAAAAGKIGVGNAINDGIGNYFAYQNYQNLLNKF